MRSECDSPTGECEKQRFRRKRPCSKGLHQAFYPARQARRFFEDARIRDARAQQPGVRSALAQTRPPIRKKNVARVLNIPVNIFPPYCSGERVHCQEAWASDAIALASAQSLLAVLQPSVYDRGMDERPASNRVICQQCGRLAMCELTAKADGSFDNRRICEECRRNKQLRQILDELKPYLDHLRRFGAPP